MLRLNIVGAGRVGSTLGRLWHEHGIFKIGAIANRTLGSARRAGEFIGAGSAKAAIEELGKADVYMLSVADDAIDACASRLAASAAIDAKTIVFHCSGAESSHALDALRSRGAQAASIHPIRSFADAEASVRDFSATPCAIEGDAQACAVLSAALERCGAVCFAVDTQHKLIYHAGTVLVCNYFVALLEAGLTCFEQAGIERPQALAMVTPLLRSTIENVSRFGTIDALTGPIARGDDALVGEQLAALRAWNRDIGTLYTQLGQRALALAKQRHNAPQAALARLQQLLDADVAKTSK